MSLLLLVACTKGKESAEPLDTEYPGNIEDRPEITSVDHVGCITEQSAGDVWTVIAKVEDPQGKETVPGGMVTVLENDKELASYELVCSNGDCIASFRDSFDGIDCSYMGKAVLKLVVTDAEGNPSAPLLYDTAL
jgi:hypothetical protein